MISMMAFCNDIEALLKVKMASKKNAALMGNEKWMMQFYNKIEEVKAKISENPLLDIICFDLGESEGISYARYLRKCYEQAMLVLLTDENTSPREYVRPDIMPSGLIIQPATSDEINRVIYEVFESFMEQIRLREINKSYVVATRDGRINIPYRKIEYFESRNKKIYIRFDNKEISFYSTMAQVQDELDNTFIRTHRSFIVNRHLIRKINLTDKTIVLKNEVMVPISRTYKHLLKEMGE